MGEAWSFHRDKFSAGGELIICIYISSRNVAEFFFINSLFSVKYFCLLFQLLSQPLFLFLRPKKLIYTWELVKIFDLSYAYAKIFFFLPREQISRIYLWTQKNTFIWYIKVTF